MKGTLLPDPEPSADLIDRLILVVEALLGEVCSGGWSGRLQAPLLWAFARIIERRREHELVLLIALLVPLRGRSGPAMGRGRIPPSRGDSRVVMALAAGMGSRYFAWLVSDWNAPHPIARGYSSIARGAVAFLGPVIFSGLGRAVPSRAYIVAIS